MKRDDLPKELKYFLESSIDSIEQLRVLILMHANPDKVWTTNEIAIILRSVDTSIQKRLLDIYSRKILLAFSEKEDLHKFLPSSTAMKEIIDSMVVENQLRPYQIIDAIYSSSDKTILDLANAFKMRGDKP